MNKLYIRPFRNGEELILRDVFYSSVHGIARSHYSQRQLDAWAPRDYAPETWARRIRENQPYVAELDGELVGFADIQRDGYIDQFFVAEKAAGKGVGGALMRRLEQQADSWHLTRLSSNVSLAAQPFFRRFGFRIVQRQTVTISGVSLVNARMEKLMSDPCRSKSMEP